MAVCLVERVGGRLPWPQQSGCPMVQPIQPMPCSISSASHFLRLPAPALRLQFTDGTCAVQSNFPFLQICQSVPFVAIPAADPLWTCGLTVRGSFTCGDRERCCCRFVLPPSAAAEWCCRMLLPPNAAAAAECCR